MRLLIAAALLFPSVLEGQDTVRQRASDLEAWRQRQVAIAESSRVERTQRRERDQKALADLGRQVERLQLVRRDWGYAAEASLHVDFARAMQGFDRWGDTFERWRDNLAIDHEQRRDRLREDDSSATHLDAARRTGDHDHVVAALDGRIKIVERFKFLADSYAQEAEERATWADYWWREFLAANRPEAPSELKLRLRVGIEHYRRLASYARAIVEFESAQHEMLSAEQASLLHQIAPPLPSDSSVVHPTGPHLRAHHLLHGEAP